MRSNGGSEAADVGILDAQQQLLPQPELSEAGVDVVAADQTIESQMSSTTLNNDDEEDIKAAASSARDTEDLAFEEGEENNKTARWDVFKALKDVEIPGDISAGGAASELPNILGLQVGGTNISLPINDLQMPALKNHAEPIFGDNFSLSRSRAAVYQIEADKISIGNPKFDGELKNELLKRAMTGLGIDPANVQHTLQRLVMITEGADAKTKKCNSVADGRLASLVIQLPSCYTGGEYHISYGEKGKEFKLGAGPSGDAPYGCHFVCYYDDCDVNIKPILSGCLLELVYAIHYSAPPESIVSMPNASRACSTMMTLERSLNLLPRTDRVFLLPLDKKYNQYALAKKGIDALQGQDRAKAQAIEAAGRGWGCLEVCVVEATRVDDMKSEEDRYDECGYGNDYYSDGDVRDTTLQIKQVFGEDGKMNEASTEWAKKIINFDSANKSGNKGRGMILAYEVGKVPNDDDVGSVEIDGGHDAGYDDGDGDGCHMHETDVYKLTDIWGEGKSHCAFEAYSGSPYDQVTYKSNFLLVLDAASKFEIECNNYIADSAVQKLCAAKDYHLLDRLVSVLQSKSVQSKLLPSSCEKLLKMIVGHHEGAPCVIDKKRMAYAKVLLDNLDPDYRPEQALYDLIIDACKVIDSRDLANSAAKTIEAKTRALYRIEHYLTRIDFVLRLRGLVGTEMADELLLLCCDGLDKLMADNQLRPTTEPIARLLESMVAQHGWGSMESPTASIIRCLRASQNQARGEESTDELLRRTSMLLELVSSHPCASLESHLRDAVKDILSKLEKPDCLFFYRSTFDHANTQYNILLRPGSALVLPTLFQYGSREDFDRFGQWAVTTSRNLDTLLNVVDKASGTKDLKKDIVNKCLIQYTDVWVKFDKSILQKVLLIFPTIISTKDDFGRLPIHCAIASNCTPVPNLMELFTAYPMGAVITEPESNYRTRVGSIPFYAGG